MKLVRLIVACVACGGTSAPTATIEPLPPSPVASATTVTSRPREPERADVLAFCERYRRAMEARDADALMALVSRRYADNGSTYATLATSMHRLLAAANQIRYEIRYGAVETRANGTVAIEYDYFASFLTASGWQHSADRATLVLERRGDSFAILSGM